MMPVSSVAVAELLKREAVALVAATSLLFEALAKISPMRTTGSVLESHRSGVWGEEAQHGCGYPVLRSTNMRGSAIDLQDVAWRHVPELQAARLALQTGDILVTKSSGSSDLVGKSVLFTHPGDSRLYLFSNFTHRLRPDPEVVEPRYLAWFLRSAQALRWRSAAQQNAVGLRNLQTEEYLSQLIPAPEISVQRSVADYLDGLEQGRDQADVLPPALAEQRRVVARVDTLAKQINEAKLLRDQTKSQRASLWVSAVEGAFARLDEYSKPVSTVLTRIKREVILQPGMNYRPAGLTNQAKGVIQYGAISSEDTKYTSLFAVEDGDLVYSKLKVWEGSVAIVRAEDRERVVSSEFPVFTVDYSAVDREYLDQWLRRPSLWAWLGEQVRGIGGRKIRVDERTFLRSPLQLPPLQVQRSVVEQLGPLRAAIAGLTHLQEVTTTELNALMPAILDRAFKGEL